MNKYVKSIIAVLLLALTLVAFTYGFKADDGQKGDSIGNTDTDSEHVIEFETSPGFFEKNVRVVIKKNRDCDIYYTTDGNVPGETVDIKECKVYNEGGILLRGPKEGITVNSITARACWKTDGSDELTWSEPIINTYVVGGTVDERFQNTTVFITCDPEKLFGYESGILVPGKLRDDWIKANPREEVIAISPAGYMLRGWESERVVNVEFFTSDGMQVINQTVGARPSGAYSRASKLKSIKLFARSDYEVIDNKFCYQLFGDQYAWDGSGRIITDYKRILLRSGGSDVRASQMRDEVHQMLAYDAGIIGAQLCEPVAVFINGQYYGSMWAHEVISDKWFEDHFGTYPGFMAVASGPERSKPDKRYAIDSIEEDQFFYDEWNALYEKYGSSDMTDDAVYEEFCSVLDVENYLFYYAINVYINNNDWPNNNHKCYRYYAAEGEEYREGTIFDGKWRFLPHDMDWIWGPTQDVLNTNLVSSNTRSKIFKALMKRDECVDMFIGYLMELVNGAFSTENYLSKINSMHEERLNELEHYTSESAFKVSSMKTMLEAVEKNRDYAIRRPDTLIPDLKRAFKISGKTYDVHIDSPENCYITTGNWEINEEFNGNYVVEHGVTYICHPFVGYEFSHWTVNGDVIRSEELYISEHYIDQKSLEVKAHVVPKTAMTLMIVEYSSEGNEDYLVLYNPSTTEAISTYGYSLSDSEKKLGKYMLPARIVEPQTKVKVYCDNYSGAEKYHQMAVPFNLKEGEVLYLSKTGEILEAVTLMHLNDGYSAVRSLKDNKFYETRID
ncbi:MAG: hypothetical protein E7615_04025 [Ruminococcaceae bacterium]|nr:hypothetical protein [Oscillospiraceae bacterium]